MTRPAFPILSVLVLALLPLASLDAQTRSAATASVAPGATVRAARSGVRLTGRVQNATHDTLLVALEEGDALRLPLADVDTLWRAGRATGRGAAIGAVAGGILLAGFGVLAVQGLCETSDCSDDTWKAALGGAAIGAAGGAVLGAGLGSLVRTWRRVYP